MPAHIDIVSYHCPDPWQAPGIDAGAVLRPIQAEENDALGAVDVVTRHIPEGAPSGSEAEIVSFSIETDHAELACALCGRARPLWGSGPADLLCSRINDYRLTQPPECGGDCAQLLLCPRLGVVAQHMADILADGDPISDGRFHLQGAGVSFFHQAFAFAEVLKPNLEEIAVSKDDIDEILFGVGGWLLDAGIRGALLSHNLTRIGAFFSWSGTVGGADGKWHVALGATDLEVQSAADEIFEGIPPTAWACSFACAKKLQYYRRKIAETWGGGSVLSDFISFRWTNPPLCNLSVVTLVGDVRGPRYQMIATSGTIPESKTDVPLLGGNTVKFEMANIPPYPGEFFQIWGTLQGVDDPNCNPILIGACYFTHFCYTSGAITSILLYDGGVIEERTSGSTPAEWVGDTRLRYRVRCEGVVLMVIPSDFASYRVTDRVVIHKGGKHSVRTASGGMREEAGCQDPEGGTPNDLLRWDLCRPFPEHVQGEIIPQQFWGI